MPASAQPRKAGPVLSEDAKVTPRMAGKMQLMVSVAQLVEPRIVIPAVVGSSPIGHPRFAITKTRSSIYGIVTEGHRGPLAQ